mmetsp:Transcript_34211/g.63786  ORF Transcript_34211/g.63786 Transcript_34211/m.63786 type:complete len:214 (+) Transcript_34211:92-733(+)
MMELRALFGKIRRRTKSNFVSFARTSRSLETNVGSTPMGMRGEKNSTHRKFSLSSRSSSSGSKGLLIDCRRAILQVSSCSSATFSGCGFTFSSLNGQPLQIYSRHFTLPPSCVKISAKMRKKPSKMVSQHLQQQYVFLANRSSLSATHGIITFTRIPTNGAITKGPFMALSRTCRLVFNGIRRSRQLIAASPHKLVVHISEQSASGFTSGGPH